MKWALQGSHGRESVGKCSLEKVTLESVGKCFLEKVTLTFKISQNLKMKKKERKKMIRKNLSGCFD